jgi:hypothetical protein
MNLACNNFEYRVYVFWDQLMAMHIYLKFMLSINIVFLMSMNTVWFIKGPFKEIVFGGKQPIDKKLE